MVNMEIQVLQLVNHAHIPASNAQSMQITVQAVDRIQVKYFTLKTSAYLSHVLMAIMCFPKPETIFVLNVVQIVKPVRLPEILVLRVLMALFLTCSIIHACPSVLKTFQYINLKTQHQ